MAELRMLVVTDRKDQLFDVVRRGYEVDQVNQYVDELNSWWTAELDRVVGERDRRIAELEEMTADVTAAKQERESLARMLDDANEQRKHILEDAEQKASRLVTDTEQEMSKLRRDTESAMAELRSEADARKDERINAASVEAKAMIENAKTTIASLEKQSQQRLTEAELATDARIDSRTRDAERKHNAQMREYARAEHDLSARIDYLRSVRESLVASLEAIASGALKSAEEQAAQAARVAQAQSEAAEADLPAYVDPERPVVAGDHLTFDTNGVNPEASPVDVVEVEQLAGPSQ